MKKLHLTVSFEIDRAERTVGYWFSGKPVMSYGQYLRAFSKSTIMKQEFMYSRFLLMELQDILKLSTARSPLQAPQLNLSVDIQGVE